MAWFDRFEVPRKRRAGVLLWLNLLAALDFALALTLVLGGLPAHRPGPNEYTPTDPSEWQNRILGIVHRMLANPRHRRASSNLVSID